MNKNILFVFNFSILYDIFIKTTCISRTGMPVAYASILLGIVRQSGNAVNSSNLIER